MLSRAIAFAVLVLLVCWGRNLIYFYASTRIALPKVEIVKLHDAESILAQGGKLNLGCLDPGTLQLVPGISDRLMVNIMEKSSVLLTRAEGLELVHGIGEKTARKLERYLVIRPCGIAGSSEVKVGGQLEVSANSSKKKKTNSAEHSQARIKKASRGLVK